MLKNNKLMRRLFIYVVRRTKKKDYVFPTGGIIDRGIDNCTNLLTAHYGALSEIRMVDYCVYQMYRVSCMAPVNQSRWKVYHAFTPNAIDNFLSRKKGGEYYENNWLSGYNITREQLVRYIDNRYVHPMAKFIYPEYEERTKKRAISTDAGYHICLLSTLLWTPHSKACTTCVNASKCKERTGRKYPELYRLRLESMQNRKEVGNE